MERITTTRDLLRVHSRRTLMETLYTMIPPDKIHTEAIACAVRVEHRSLYTITKPILYQTYIISDLNWFVKVSPHGLIPVKDGFYWVLYRQYAVSLKWAILAEITHEELLA